jgi:diguanylate cyclase (GGDEF)-like protein
LLGDRVEQAVLRSRRTDATTAVLMLDLDRFKEVNDSLGHQAGDQLLKEVAQRLTGCVRESDTVSRLGGDEFVVLLAETAGPGDAEIAARKILAALGRPFLLQGHEARIGVSIGVSVFPEDGADADSLLRTADEAMYRVKRAGRNNFAFAARRERSA